VAQTAAADVGVHRKTLSEDREARLARFEAIMNLVQ